MRFKRSFRVFCDNFSSLYQLLAYQLIVLAIVALIFMLGIVPMFRSLISASEFGSLKEAIANLVNAVSSADYDTISKSISDLLINLNTFFKTLFDQSGRIFSLAFSLLGLCLLRRFLLTIGNFAQATLINERMTMQSKGHLLFSLIRSVKENLLYTLTYTGITFAYDVIFGIIGFFILLAFPASILLPIRIFLFVVFMIVILALRMVFFSQMLPATIVGKMKIGESIAQSVHDGAMQFGQSFSGFVVLATALLVINVACAVFSFGAALLISVPASYTLLHSLIFVTYFDNHKLKYFMDAETIVRPKTTEMPTREQFFKGTEE